MGSGNYLRPCIFLICNRLRQIDAFHFFVVVAAKNEQPEDIEVTILNTTTEVSR